ncbi:PRC-barrel domain-containing protein [Methylocapsa palsarum]|uniref:Sporulation protein YlmC, PRC-barrel domain family n=1 Tax=Methylocapsa palsarum TaxID=1612308 RepID=A0A1I3XKI6_9HYPH|nr:PRC-barrel domain-containing protein [Methylocapsa palsarum]SFK19551.1 Sporulation protein YlmC, PRC-barrel domain family [Methylocapsa palsarum]
MGQYAGTTSTDMAQSEHGNLIAASKVNGTNIYNPDGESLGSIYDVMIDKMTGRVAYAVMAFGGFLGIGEDYHPLPWNVLKYNEQFGGYVVDISPDRLKQGPAFHQNETPEWSAGYGGEIDDYYGKTIL